MCYFDHLRPAFGHDFQQYAIAQASQWGWDQRGAATEAELQKARDEELDACCEVVSHWLGPWHPGIKLPDRLRAARRPNARSLKERIAAAITDGDEHLALQLLNEALPND